MRRFITLALSKWEYQYHLVWIPKYRRKDFYGIKKWSKIIGIEIAEGHAMKGHIHLCLSIPPKLSISSVVGTLKGKSASEAISYGSRSNRMAHGRQFWARGYCVSTVGLDESTVRNYIKNRKVEDQ